MSGAGRVGLTVLDRESDFPVHLLTVFTSYKGIIALQMLFGSVTKRIGSSSYSTADIY